MSLPFKKEALLFLEKKPETPGAKQKKLLILEPWALS
jgi:hypothetical protein